MPLILGHEVAGTVVAVGRERARAPAGRPGRHHAAHACVRACRYCRGGREPLCAEACFLGDAGLNGGYAEYVALDADGTVAVPEGVATAHASIAACAIGTAFHAVSASAGWRRRTRCW